MPLDLSRTQYYPLVINFDFAAAAGAWRKSEALQALTLGLGALSAGSSLQDYDVIA